MSLGARLLGAISDIKSSPQENAKPFLPASETDANGANDVAMPTSGYLAVLLLRQVVSPLVGMLVAIGLLRHILGVDDPVVLLVGMLQTAGPPMINLGVMAGLSGSAETVTAKLLLVTYAASIASWTFWIAMFLRVL